MPRIGMHHCRMSRTKRPFLPGAAFHVTSRIQGRARCLDEQLRGDVVCAIRDSLHKSDARLIAFAVMTNHLHLIFRQGIDPLAALMQPLLTRVALRVRKKTGWIDHVVGQRFFAKPCKDAEHLRIMISYVHRNPVALGICQDPIDYEWSSERAYRLPHKVRESWLTMPMSGLNLFASHENSTHAELVSNYKRYLAWRMDLKNDPAEITAIDFRAGNAYWDANFSGITVPPRIDNNHEDLRDIALRVLAVRLPGITFEDFLLQRCGPRFVAARREIVTQGIRANFKGTTIARFLKLSDATISKIRASLAPLRRDDKMRRP